MKIICALLGYHKMNKLLPCTCGESREVSWGVRKEGGGENFCALSLGCMQQKYNKQSSAIKENNRKPRLELEEGLEGSLVGASG